MFDQAAVHICYNCGHHVTRHEMIPIQKWTRRTKQPRQIPLHCQIRGCICSNYQEVKA